MRNSHSEKFLRKRKFLLALPPLTLPFVTLAFWSMGGGSGTAAVSPGKGPAGLNLDLPDAKLAEEGSMNKLSFYNQAQEDSIRHRLEMQNDPYYKNRLDTVPIPVNLDPEAFPSQRTKTLNGSPYSSQGNIHSTEAKINERLATLTKAMQDNAAEKSNVLEDASLTNSSTSMDVARLESLMQTMNETASDDPELKELNGMLEKILDIQHPERVKGRLKDKDDHSKVAKSSANISKDKVQGSYFGKEEIRNKPGFFGTAIGEPIIYNAAAIPAVIQEAQTVSSGSTIKLRLTADANIKETIIPSGSFVFGVATLQNERLQIEIKSARVKSTILPLSLDVYDMDGLRGVYVPGSMSRDVLKASADQSLQSMDMISLDPSLKAQAASAGIQTIKGLLSRKVKQAKVTLKGGYAVLLKSYN